jgi:hypothetical protein
VCNSAGVVLPVHQLPPLPLPQHTFFWVLVQGLQIRDWVPCDAQCGFGGKKYRSLECTGPTGDVVEYGLCTNGDYYGSKPYWDVTSTMVRVALALPPHAGL